MISWQVCLLWRVIKIQFLGFAVTAVLINNGFDSSGVDTRVWRMPVRSFTLGRTWFRSSENSSMPSVEDGAIHFRLDTYSRKGHLLIGDQLVSRKKVFVKTGLEVRFRARLNSPIVGGIIVGLFIYGSSANSHGENDEVDFEILSNDLIHRRNRIQTNVYHNEKDGVGKSSFCDLPKGHKLAGWHTYEMRVLPKYVNWYVDGHRIRTERNDVPKGPFLVVMNFWAADKGWHSAYDSRLKPTKNPCGNREYSMDVSSILVRQIKPKK